MTTAKPCAYVFPLAPEATRLHASLAGTLGIYFDRRWFGTIPLLPEPKLSDALRDRVFDALNAQIEALGLPKRLFAPGIEPKAVRSFFGKYTIDKLRARAARERWQLLEPHEAAPGALDPSATATKRSAGVAPSSGQVAPKPIPPTSKMKAQVVRIAELAGRAGLVLPRGASEKAIVALEAQLGVALPPEVRAFYLAHDGGPAQAPMFRDRLLLSLDGIASEWSVWAQIGEELDDDDDDDDIQADKGVRRDRWNRKWIPVTSDRGGNGERVDLDPARGGTSGQIIGVYHDGDTRSLEGPNLLDWLERELSAKSEKPAAKKPAAKKPAAKKPAAKKPR